MLLLSGCSKQCDDRVAEKRLLYSTDDGWPAVRFLGRLICWRGFLIPVKREACAADIHLPLMLPPVAIISHSLHLGRVKRSVRKIERTSRRKSVLDVQRSLRTVCYMREDSICCESFNLSCVGSMTNVVHFIPTLITTSAFFPFK